MRYLPRVEGVGFPLPCEMDPERWFADAKSPTGLEMLESAVRACHGCPVLDACRKYTDAVRPDFGVWAGRYYFSRADRFPQRMAAHVGRY